MSEIEDSVICAHANHTYPDVHVQIARDVLETQFALALCAGLIPELIDSRLPPREHMAMLRALPKHTWDLARDWVKYKYPKLYPAVATDDDYYPPIGEGSFNADDYTEDYEGPSNYEADADV